VAERVKSQSVIAEWVEAVWGRSVVGVVDPIVIAAFSIYMAVGALVLRRRSGRHDGRPPPSGAVGQYTLWVPSTALGRCHCRCRQVGGDCRHEHECGLLMSSSVLHVGGVRRELWWR
jgi:hypothetical protein